MAGASHLYELALKKTPSVEKLTLHKAQVLECTLCASGQGPLPSAAAARGARATDDADGARARAHR